MDVTMMLCDHADAANGKLFINGAGWNMLRADAPTPMALGVIVSVPWDQTNVQHTLDVELVDEDGHRVTINGQEIHEAGPFEAGRPVGLPPGTPMELPLALRWPLLALPVGGYSFVVKINDTEEARVSFRALEQP